MIFILSGLGSLVIVLWYATFQRYERALFLISHAHSEVTPERMKSIAYKALHSNPFSLGNDL